SPVLVNNGGLALSLFASATGTGGNGNVWITDDSGSLHTLTLSNTVSTPLSAGTLFDLINSNGSIVANVDSSTAVTAPSISLVATTGNIGTSSVSRVLVNNSGSALSLFASATGTGGRKSVV